MKICILTSALVATLFIVPVHAAPKGTVALASKGEIPSAFVSTNGLRLSANPWQKPFTPGVASSLESFTLNKTMLKTQVVPQEKILVKAAKGTGTFSIGPTF